MKILAAAFLALYLVGCTTTKVVVVTVVTKANKDAQPDYYEGVMDKRDIKKLLNDTIDGTPKKEY